MSTDRGNSAGYVSAAYLIVLLPWTFLYAHDFISGKWLTIRRTWKNGILHIVVISIPVPYIIYYTVLQSRLADPDYKELCTAITALLLSAYHFLRTVWGLIQLYHFRKWAIEISEIMESAAYTVSIAASRRRSGRKWRPYRLLESLFSLVEGVFRTLSGFSDKVRKKHDEDEDSRRRSLFNVTGMMQELPAAKGSHRLSPEQMERIMENVDRMTVNSSLIDNEFVSSSSPTVIPAVTWPPFIHLRSVEPEVTFVRWCVAYLANFGCQWVQDIEKLKSVDEETWSGKRWKLAMDVMATAALRMETVQDTSQEGWPATSSEIFPLTSFLSLSRWLQISKYQDDQVFSMEQVLRETFSSGLCLPFGGEIMKEKGDTLPSWGMYRPLIKETVESLQPRFYGDMENFTPKQLEWFLTFIWVHRWSPAKPSSIGPQTAHAGKIKRSSTPWDKLSELDSPLRLLQDQLGLDAPPSLISFAYPLHREAFEQFLWDSRSILQVSARIDNWLAIHSGSQVAFLLSKDPSAAKRLGELVAGDYGDENHKTPLSRREEDRRGRRLFHLHRDLEMRQLRYQLANSQVRHKHMEQGMTFLGCVYESVRSALAEQIFLRPERIDKTWISEIPDERIPVCISRELWGCVSRGMKGDDDFDSAAQERLLWECQRGVYKSLREKTQGKYASSNTVQSFIEPMMLLVMGFPSVAVHPVRDEWQSALNIPNLRQRYVIQPTAAPQDLAVYVQVFHATSVVTLRLGPTKLLDYVDSAARPAPHQFRWRDWRNAFDGRLAGRSQWQKAHFMRDVRVHHTSSRLSRTMGPIHVSGGTWDDLGQVWRGWRPFRANMALFELKHVSAIVTRSGLSRDRLAVLSKELWEAFEAGRYTVDHAVKSKELHDAASRAYNEASLAVLSSAMLQLDTALKLGRGMNNWKSGPRQRGEDRPQHGFQNPELPRSAARFASKRHPPAQKAFRSPPAVVLDDMLLPQRFPSLRSPARGSLRRSSSWTEAKDEKAGSLGLLGSGDDQLKEPNSTVQPFLRRGRSGREYHSGVDQDIDALLVKFQAAARSPDASKGGLSPSRSESGTSSVFPQKGPSELSADGTFDPEAVAKAIELDLDAMRQIAEWVLKGEHGFLRDREGALQLMERALFLGRDVETASLLVKTLIDRSEGTSEAKHVENVDRALFAVDLLWHDLDVPSQGQKTNVETAVNHLVNEVDEQEAEDERLRTITDLHKQLIHEKPTSAMMRDLANRLSVWGITRKDKETAASLYESAIIASCDIQAMIGLAILRGSDDIAYSIELLKRACREMGKLKNREERHPGIPGLKIVNIVEEMRNGLDIQTEGISPSDMQDVNSEDQAVAYIVMNIAAAGNVGAQRLLEVMDKWQDRVTLENERTGEKP